MLAIQVVLSVIFLVFKMAGKILHLRLAEARYVFQWENSIPTFQNETIKKRKSYQTLKLD